MTRRYLPLLAWLVAGFSSPVLAQPVGPEFQVNTYTTGRQQDPDVASDSTGNFVVVWSGSGQGNGDGIFGQRYDGNGNPLGAEFQVNTYTQGHVSYPSVASDTTGNFVVVWDRQDGFYRDIIGQRYDNNGNPLGAEFRVNSFASFDQRNPALTSDASGNFVVVWQSDGQEGYRNTGIFGQLYDSSGDRLGGEFQVNTYTTDKQDTPSVASDAGGNFVVVWRSAIQDGSAYGVFGQLYDSSGNRVGGEFQANTYTTRNQYFPSVASDASGNFVVVWSGAGMGDGSGVFGQRYNSNGNRLGGEFEVNTYTAGAQVLPAVASDPSGKFVVVWYGAGTGDDAGIFGRRYNSDGNPLGGEFQVNTYTAEAQFVPAVASDATGNFVVVWESYGQDGSDEGIFGQRFAGQANPLGCDDLRSVRVRCHNGDLQVGFALVDDSHDGDTLTLRVNGQDRVLTINGDRAKASGPGRGLNTLLLVDPPDCADEKTVQCP